MKPCEVCQKPTDGVIDGRAYGYPDCADAPMCGDCQVIAIHVEHLSYERHGRDYQRHVESLRHKTFATLIRFARVKRKHGRELRQAR